MSSPEKRLTLNQIYDWLISSVMYFSERQDNLASSGWKVNMIQNMFHILMTDILQNSIRHNLSLHQRFVKVPNEDAGKSSWWTVSPDQAKPAVTKARRRATYGESRERMKKRAEAAEAKARSEGGRSGGGDGSRGDGGAPRVLGAKGLGGSGDKGNR